MGSLTKIDHITYPNGQVVQYGYYASGPSNERLESITNEASAPGVQLQGPSTAIGSPHYLATQAQRAAGGGTYGAERQIAIQSLKAAGYTDAQAAQALKESDVYFNGIRVTNSTVTRIPGNRSSP